MIDRACEGITESAELFAVGMRISGRLGWTHPDIAGFLTGASMDALDSPTAWPAALAAVALGRVTAASRSCTARILD